MRHYDVSEKKRKIQDRNRKFDLKGWYLVEVLPPLGLKKEERKGTKRAKLRLLTNPISTTGV